MSKTFFMYEKPVEGLGSTSAFWRFLAISGANYAPSQVPEDLTPIGQLEGLDESDFMIKNYHTINDLVDMVPIGTLRTVVEEVKNVDKRAYAAECIEAYYGTTLTNRASLDRFVKKIEQLPLELDVYAYKRRGRAEGSTSENPEFESTPSMVFFLTAFEERVEFKHPGVGAGPDLYDVVNVHDYLKIAQYDGSSLVRAGKLTLSPGKLTPFMGDHEIREPQVLLTDNLR